MSLWKCTHNARGHEERNHYAREHRSTARCVGAYSSGVPRRPDAQCLQGRAHYQMPFSPLLHNMFVCTRVLSTDATVVDEPAYEIKTILIDNNCWQFISSHVSDLRLKQKRRFRYEMLSNRSV